jgi:nitrogen fixation NifU-like protein
MSHLGQSQSGSQDMQLYQQVVLEHNKRPRNFKTLEHATHKAEGFNPICGDHYHVEMILEDGRIVEVVFQGDGCAISKASASMMTEKLKGLTESESDDIFQSFRRLLAGKSESGDEERLGKLRIFSGVHKYPSRVKCAGLAWHAAKAAIVGDQVATTE